MNGASRPVLLIVDDEARILSALRRTLRREGFEIVTAENAAEALGILETRDVDVVLSDHKMPGMSGLDLLERVGQLRPGAARLLITGWTEEVPSDRIRSLGIRALINKPWDDSELKGALRASLG